MTHHAFLYQAPAVSKETALPLLPLLGASETEFIEVDGFGIDDVRSLTAVAYRTPSTGDRLGVVVIAKTITVEAGQALLKLLEEPPETTAFLFCISEGVFLLPTLLSRFSVIGGAVNRELTPAFINFLSLSVPERINLIGSRLNDKDLEWQYDIKQGLTAFLFATKAHPKIGDLSIIYYILEHLLTRGASNKQLLEELAFSLPCLPVQ
jgi:hypothetical protein